MAIYTEKTIDKVTGKKVDKLVDGKKVYYIRTYITDENGDKKQITRHNKKWIGKPGYKEAQLEDAKLQNQCFIETKKEKITLYQLMEKYIDYRRDSLDEDTVYKKEVLLKHFCDVDPTKQVDTYPKKYITEFNINIYLKFKKQIKEKKYKSGKNTYKNFSYEYLNRLHNEICRMIDFGIDNGYCNTNFARQAGQIGSPKEILISRKQKIYETIDYQEYCNLMKASKDNLKYNTYFQLDFTRGPRTGEIRAFRCKDYNKSKHQLMVNHTMSKKNKLKEPKTASSKAPIDLDDELNNKICKLIDILKKEPDFNENWYIFGGEKPISSHALEYNKNKYFELAGINKHIRLHDFRHSCASWLCSIGTPITVISKILRHANVNETLKTYTHLFNKDYEDALKDISNWMKKHV